MLYPFRIYLSVLILVLILTGYSKQVFGQRKAVDIVFCMDLSGSTNGLMDDLRDHIWDISEQFLLVQPDIDLRLGVVGYSRPSFGKANGYSKVISPLTDDLDQLSFDVFSMKPYIEKGDQMVGAALQTAVKDISWSRQEQAVKIIFLIGNGSVSLGPVDFRASGEEAAQRGILIFPVYCTMADKAKEITGWLEIARISGTEIQEVAIHSRLPLKPVCNDIPALKEADIELMKTYICYGEKGFSRLKLVKEADNRAFQAGSLSFEARMNYKMKYMGSALDWDLVDYLKEKGDLPEFDHNTLADTLKMIPDDNLKRVVVKTKEQRNAILGQINRLLPSDRRQQLSRQLTAMQLIKSDALEFVVVEAYRKTLLSRGFTLK